MKIKVRNELTRQEINFLGRCLEQCRASADVDGGVTKGDEVPDKDNPHLAPIWDVLEAKLDAFFSKKKELTVDVADPPEEDE